MALCYVFRQKVNTLMKIFLLDGINSRFVDVRKDFINLYTQSKDYVFDYQITQPRIVRWLATGKLKNLPPYRPVLWVLWDYMGKPYADFEQWLYSIEELVNQVSTKELEQVNLPK